MVYLKISGWVANSVDPDEMMHSVAAHLGLHHNMLMPVCPNTYGKYSISELGREIRRLHSFTDNLGHHSPHMASRPFGQLDH